MCHLWLAMGTLLFELRDIPLYIFYYTCLNSDFCTIIFCIVLYCFVFLEWFRFFCLFIVCVFFIHFFEKIDWRIFFFFLWKTVFISGSISHHSKLRHSHSEERNWERRHASLQLQKAHPPGQRDAGRSPQHAAEAVHGSQGGVQQIQLWRAFIRGQLRQGTFRFVLPPWKVSCFSYKTIPNGTLSFYRMGPWLQESLHKTPVNAWTCSKRTLTTSGDDTWFTRPDWRCLDRRPATTRKCRGLNGNCRCCSACTACIISSCSASMLTLRRPGRCWIWRLSIKN